MLGEFLKKQDARALRAKNRIVMIVYALGLLLSPVALFKVYVAYGWSPTLAIIAGIALSLPVAVLNLRKTRAPSDRLIAALLAGICLPLTGLILWNYINDLTDRRIAIINYRSLRYAAGGLCLVVVEIWFYWHELKRQYQAASNSTEPSSN